jgi:hypothetical protein
MKLISSSLRHLVSSECAGEMRWVQDSALAFVNLLWGLQTRGSGKPRQNCKDSASSRQHLLCQLFGRCKRRHGKGVLATSVPGSGIKYRQWQDCCQCRPSHDRRILGVNDKESFPLLHGPMDLNPSSGRARLSMWRVEGRVERAPKERGFESEVRGRFRYEQPAMARPQ